MLRAIDALKGVMIYAQQNAPKGEVIRNNLKKGPVLLQTGFQPVASRNRQDACSP